MDWDDGDGRFFNPAPTVGAVALPGGHQVVVVDDVLLDPDGLVAWACGQAFQPPPGYPYPGLVLPAPASRPASPTSSRSTRARGYRRGARASTTCGCRW